MSKERIARLANTPEDYKRLGLKKDKIEKWEDSLHTTGKFGEYEWWYFDAKLNDGWSLVIGFYTQPVTACSIGFTPSITFALTKDGEEIRDAVGFKASDCTFKKDHCYAQFGNNIFEGDLENYHIHFESDTIKADVTLSANASSWRPETGYFLFDEKKYFAWLPSVPEGTVDATIITKDKTLHLAGTGYHDHNWGNIGMFWVMHHWYWGRAKVGDYQIISSYITAHKPYGYEHFPIFLISKNGEKLGDNPKYLTYSQHNPAFDPVTQKHYHKELVYDYNDGTQHYRVTYSAENIIEYFTVAHSKTSVQAKSNPLLLWIVKQAKLDPSYIRMIGTVTLECFDKDELIEKIEAPGLWEQMYFGLDRDV